VVLLAVISILLFALSFRMFTGLFRRRTYCAAANGTRLSTNRPAHGMNSMSSNWGTSGGQPSQLTMVNPMKRAANIRIAVSQWKIRLHRSSRTRLHLERLAH